VLLFALGKVTKREILFFITGFLVGCVFEFFIWFMGPSFFFVKMPWPLPWPTYYICHSLWDGGLFMAGYFLAGILLRKPRTILCTVFDWRELAVMTAWGAITAFFVEVSGNGIIWQYIPQRWNPAWTTIGGQSYTIFIQAVWLVVPAVFYCICLAISRASMKR
jgi:hypothetical protein